MTRNLHWLAPGTPPEAFPDARLALSEPNGLLAVGGDLAPRRLLYAYAHGIFPWYDREQPILWWSPNPRAVLFLDEFRPSRSLRKRRRRADYEVSLDRCFDAVIDACAEPRQSDSDTWITPEMCTAYSELHRLGHAHSVEAWADGSLVGGLYGVALGKVFFGESMFSRAPDASKVALAALIDSLRPLGYKFIDCQLDSAHLRSLGARLVQRDEFLLMLARHCTIGPKPAEFPAQAARNDPSAPPGSANPSR